MQYTKTSYNHDISSDKKLILSKTYAGRELLSVLGGMVKLNQFVNDDDRVNKKDKLKGITDRTQI